MMNSILIASKNAGKLDEYRHLLSEYGYEIKSLFDYPGLEEIDEPFLTFEENAMYKAQTLYNHLHQSVIADDSGLMVEALNGEPGVHSKRFSAEGTTEANNQLLLTKMSGNKNRKARFVAVIAYIDESGNSHLFRGDTEGYILDKPEGKNGFGYDPLFFVKELNKSFAELTMNEKNTISHRAKAFQKLMSYLEKHHETRRV